MNGRIHLPALDHRGQRGPTTRLACGRPWTDRTRIGDTSDDVTCLRCKTVVDRYIEVLERQRVEEYEKRIGAPYTEQQKAAIEAYLTRPRCGETLTVEWQVLQCTLRQDHSNSHHAGTKRLIRWVTEDTYSEDEDEALPVGGWSVATCTRCGDMVEVHPEGWFTDHVAADRVNQCRGNGERPEEQP